MSMGAMTPMPCMVATPLLHLRLEIINVAAQRGAAVLLAIGMFRS